MPIDLDKGPVTVGLGMLSWRAPATVSHTLSTYEQAGLLELFDQTLIYFQQISDADRAVAAKFGLSCAGTADNRGICGGVRAMLEQMHTDYVLFVENDCVLVEGRDEAERQIRCAVEDLATGRADVHRMRHRFDPGERFVGITKYQRYFLPSDDDDGSGGVLQRLAVRGRAMLRPLKASRLSGLALYLEQKPERKHPHVFQRLRGGTYIVSSRHLNWTNQAILFERQWMLKTILPYVEANPSGRTVNGFSDIEKELNSRWWRKQDFKIGLGRGLFKHHRLDR